jgi:hypothetical protein
MTKILLLFLLCSKIINCQTNQTLENTCMGAAIAFNEALEYFPRTKIIYRNGSTQQDIKLNEVLVHDLKAQYTILLIKINDDLGYIVGYAPSLTRGQYDGFGEVVLCKRENGIASEIYYDKVQMTQFSQKNEVKFRLTNENIDLVIQDYFEVEYLKIKEVRGSYFLPSGYFFK